MGTIKYIPKRKEILDRRSRDGGYYEAECDVCGTKFYPTRVNAKYCSRSCNLILWRQNRVKKKDEEELVRKEQVKKMLYERIEEKRAQKASEASSKGSEVIQGMNNVIDYLEDNFPDDVYRKKGELKDDMRELENGEGYDYENFILRKISDRKYVVEY